VQAALLNKEQRKEFSQPPDQNDIYYTPSREQRKSFPAHVESPRESCHVTHDESPRESGHVTHDESPRESGHVTRHKLLRRI
jgi:hypothetical protein